MTNNYKARMTEVALLYKSLHGDRQRVSNPPGGRRGSGGGGVATPVGNITPEKDRDGFLEDLKQMLTNPNVNTGYNIFVDATTINISDIQKPPIINGSSEWTLEFNATTKGWLTKNFSWLRWLRQPPVEYTQVIIKGKVDNPVIEFTIIRTDGGTIGGSGFTRQSAIEHLIFTLRDA
jgi:hypothetical protein